MHAPRGHRSARIALLVVAGFATLSGSCSSSELVRGVDGAAATATSDSAVPAPASSAAPTSAPSSASPWTDVAVAIPADPNTGLDALTAIVPGRLALGTWHDNDAESRSTTWALHSDDGVSWTRTPVDATTGDEVLQPRNFGPSLVTPDATYVLATGTRLIDPHLADGSGVHADPAGFIAMVWRTTDRGTSWSHLSTPTAAQFWSIGLVAGKVWIGGEVGEQPNSTASIWSLDTSGSLHDEGTVPGTGEFQQVTGIDDVDGDVVATITTTSGATHGVHRRNGVWTTTTAPPAPETPAIDLGASAKLRPFAPTITDGDLSAVVGQVPDREALGFCFQDPTTCRRVVTAAVVRTGQGPWQRIEVPDDATGSFYFAPTIIEHVLTIYSGTYNTAPTRVAMLNLDPAALPLYVPPTEPALPSPAFDGTLVAGQPRAIEVQLGCGSERVDVNGTTMDPTEYPQTFAADVPQRKIEVSDGPYIALYGLLEMDGDGSVHLRTVAGHNVLTYKVAAPLQGACG